jgi:hypothetical protein
VTLYRALKYAHLNDAQSCSTVPILPPDYAAAAGEYLPTDADIVSGVQSGLLGMFDLNVDGLSDAPVNGNSLAIGFPDVSASRDGVYIYRNLAGNPTFIYPPYAGTGPFTPFVSPSVPVLAGVTVPSTHGVSGAAETAINVKIDVLKILGCPWLWAVPKLSIDLPLNPPPSLPCWWLVPVGEGVKTLPLPQPESSWDCSPPITGG